MHNNANKRPRLDEMLSPEVFNACYWLKSELKRFCKQNGLPVTGSKHALNTIIYEFLSSGRKTAMSYSDKPKQKTQMPLISTDQTIGHNFVFGKNSRAFFKQHCGTQFSFNVRFIKWVRDNPNKTLAEAVIAWQLIKEEKKQGQYQSEIGNQFEYNQYTRDFFKYSRDNKLKLSRIACIQCWKAKKDSPNSMSKRVLFEPNDIDVLNLDH
ncbi:MAG: DUF6434 domain-containing protein [bacterium]|nr:DUF6434 domain-containing protein [bacterium]